MNTQTYLDLTADIIDVRDIIARIEEVENDRSVLEQGDVDSDLAGVWAVLDNILSDLKGNGGDEQWRGDWYSVTLIRESYFTRYARELLEDCGTIPRDLPKWVEIDWDATAKHMLIDYASTEIDGVTYWYR